MQQQKQNNQNKIRVNQQIRVPQVRVVLEDGSSPGVMSTYDALKMARAANLDLVEINPRSVPPVCKLLNYGKYKYEEKKKANAAKKAQKQSDLKELVIRPNIGDHDLLIKLNAAKLFLQDGDKVKFTVKFRGREITHPDVGKEKLNWLLQELNDLISAVPPISSEGKFMFMIVSPK